MTTSAHRGAFTLLEVLLSVTLALGIVGSALAFYDHTVDVRSAVTGRIASAASVRAVMDRITDELRGATTSSFIGTGVEGSSREIHFITTALPGPAGWIERKSTDDPIVPEHDLQLVGYRLRSEQDDRGRTIIVGLERTCQKLLTARSVEQGREMIADLLTDRVRFLRLRYWDGSAWLSAWSGGDVPAAVEITLGREPLEEDAEPDEYAHPVWRRVVYVPSGFAGPGPAGVRGRGRGTP